MNHLSGFLGRQTKITENNSVSFRCTLISSLTHVGSLDIMNGPEPIAEEVYMDVIMKRDNYAVNPCHLGIGYAHLDLNMIL